MTDPILITAVVGLFGALSVLIREYARDRAFRRWLKRRQLGLPSEPEEDDDASPPD